MAQDYAQILVQLTLQNQEYLKQIAAAQEKTKTFAETLSGQFSSLNKTLALFGIGAIGVAEGISLLSNYLKELLK